MTLDLFNSTNESATVSAADGAASNAVQHITAGIPAPILALEEVYRSEIALRQKVLQTQGLLTIQMNGAGYDDFGCIELSPKHDLDMDRDFYYRYQQRVERFAKHELSSPGAPFTASLEHMKDQCYDLHRLTYSGDENKVAQVRKQLAELFSPITLWREIYKGFDPAAQRRAQSFKAAAIIRSCFGISQRNPAPQMKLVKGRVEVAMRAWVRMNYRGQRELSTGSDLHQLGDALQQAMTDALIDVSFPATLSRICTAMREHGSRPIQSRERIELGDNVAMVTTYETFKLYLPQQHASAINLFLAEFPPQNDN